MRGRFRVPPRPVFPRERKAVRSDPSRPALRRVSSQESYGGLRDPPTVGLGAASLSSAPGPLRGRAESGARRPRRALGLVGAEAPMALIVRITFFGCVLCGRTNVDRAAVLAVQETTQEVGAARLTARVAPVLLQAGESLLAQRRIHYSRELPLYRASFGVYHVNSSVCSLRNHIPYGAPRPL